MCSLVVATSPRVLSLPHGVTSRSIPPLLLAATTALVMATNALTAQPLPKLPTARPEWTTQTPFSAISAVRVLSNGSIILADPQDVQVYLVSADGQSVKPLGRKGSGPGEYRSAFSLIALAGDSTLLVDRDSRRYLLIDKVGKFVSTQTFPGILPEEANHMTGADASGRVFLQVGRMGQTKGSEFSAAIARWERGRDRLDTVSLIEQQNPAQKAARIPVFKKNEGVSQTVTLFEAVDDWVVGTSGRVAIVRADPYRVDWVQKNRSLVMGAPVQYTPVPVTDQDRKTREPKGPPFIRTYAKVKPPFVPDLLVPDEADNLWVGRYELADATMRRWDVFSASGKHLGTQSLPADRRLLAITGRHAYIVRTDDDGLKWLERHTR